MSRSWLRRSLVAGLAGALALAAVPAEEELTITATRETKSEVLLLLEGEIVMLSKWPLRAYLFDTAGLEGCSLSYTANIIDLEKVRLKKEGGDVTARCGKTSIEGRIVTDVSVTSGPVTSARESWRVTEDGGLLAVHRSRVGEREWTVTLARP